MNKSSKIIFGFIVGIFFISSILLNIYYYREIHGIRPIESVRIVEKVDTLRDTVLSVKYKKDIKTIKDTLNHIEVVHDTLYINGDTIITERQDSIPVVVNVPIIQKKYSNDSTYTAWVSGYRPSLDSISIYRKTVYIDRTIQDRRRFGVGPVIFGGYDIQNRKFGWGIGIGITYHIWEW